MDRISTNSWSRTVQSLLINMLPVFLLLTGSQVGPATSLDDNTEIPNPLVAVELSPMKPILEPTQPQPPTTSCLDQGKRKLVPTRTMTIRLDGMNIVDAEAVVIPYVSLARTDEPREADGNTAAAAAAPTLVFQYFPFPAEDLLRGVPTWSTSNVSCSAVTPPCALPLPKGTAEARHLRTVVSPSGRELVLLGLRRRPSADAAAADNDGDEAVYVWRDGELFHVAIDGAAKPTLTATALAASARSDTAHESGTAASVEFSVFGLYTPPDGNSSLWRLDFSGGSRSAVWSEMVVNGHTRPANVHCVEMHVNETTQHLVLFGGYSGWPGCELWVFNLATHTWRQGAEFPRNCTGDSVATTLASFLSQGVLVVIARDSQETAVSPMKYTLYMINPNDLQSTWKLIRLPSQAGGMQLASTQGYLVGGRGALYLVSDTSPYLYATTRTDNILDLKNPIGFHPVPQCTSDYGAPTSLDPDSISELAKPALQFQPPFGTGIAGDSGTHLLLGGEGWNSLLAPWSLGVVHRISNDAGPRVEAKGQLSTRSQSIPYARYVMSSSPVDQDHGLGRGRLYLAMPDPAGGNGSCRMIVHGGLSVSIRYSGQPLLSISDLWCLDTCTGKFLPTERSPSNVQPEGRFNHAGFATSERSFVIFGGSTPRLNQSSYVRDLSDVWMFTFSNVTACKGQWRNLTAAAGSPQMAPLASTSLVRFGQKAVVFGGLINSDRLIMTRNIFEISIDAGNSSYTIREVAGHESLHNRTGHALQKYGSDSLLVFGGSGTYESTNSAQLIYYSIDEQDWFIITKVVRFFTHRSMIGISVLRLHTGLLMMASTSLDDGAVPPIAFLPLGLCQAGFAEDNATQRCTPCPRSTWGDDGRRCQACPDATVTPTKGSVTADSCTPCTPSFCNSNGNCSRNGGKAVCNCHFGYYTGDNCFAPYYFIASGLISLILCSALAVTIRFTVRRRHAEKELQRELRASAKRISSFIGLWRIEWSQLRMRHVLAKGGYGEVWLAEMSDMLVVVKKLHKHCLQDEVSVHEFQREAEVMRTHRHPNIVLFLGAGADPTNEPFLVMEHVKRGSLKSLLADTSVAISHNDRLRFMLDAAKGMAYLHGSQPAIVHRDLKCANLLVTERWVVKVADFGTARLMSFLGHSEQDDSSSISESDPLLQRPEVTFNMGTAAYQSPEMIRCQAYGASTDVYSFGLVLWAAYCRKSPFYEERYRFMHKLHNAVLAGQRPGMPDDMPLEYSDLVYECWQDNDQSRPEFLEIVNRLDFQLISW